jgi:hypothetical protein
LRFGCFLSKSMRRACRKPWKTTTRNHFLKVLWLF